MCRLFKTKNRRFQLFHLEPSFHIHPKKTEGEEDGLRVLDEDEGILDDSMLRDGLIFVYL